MIGKWWVAMGVLLVVSVPTLVSAHGELQGTDPKAGAHLAQVPADVSLTFTETPAEQSRIRVKDGCDRNAIESLEFNGKRAVAHVIVDAQPGTWSVSYRVLSAEDGHISRGDYLFSVEGEADCSKPERPTPAAPPPVENDSGSSFPIVPVAIGTIVLVGAALVLRRAGG